MRNLELRELQLGRLLARAAGSHAYTAESAVKVIDAHDDQFYGTFPLLHSTGNQAGIAADRARAVADYKQYIAEKRKLDEQNNPDREKTDGPRPE